jgi:urea transport system permease protein
MMTLLCLLTLHSTVAFAEEAIATETSELTDSSIEAAPPVVIASDLAGLLAQLVSAEDFEFRATLIQHIGQQPQPQVLAILKALLESQLQFNVNNPQQVMIVATTGDDPEVIDAISGKKLGQVSKFSLDIIPVNNALRGELMTMIAKLQLASPDKKLRLAAVKQLLENEPDLQLADVIKQRLSQEQDADVKADLNVVLALMMLQSEEKSQRLQAVQQ